MKNPDTKQWPERPVKRTPKEEPEEREALEQDTKKVGRQKVKAEGPSSQSSALLDYSQATGVEKLSCLAQLSLSSSHLSPVSPWFSCLRDITQARINTYFLPPFAPLPPSSTFTFPS